jgi:hypothetical protein
MKQHSFYSVNPIQPNMPTFIERMDRKWVVYGEDNLYPQFVASLFYKSAINRTAIQSKIDAAIGEGLKTTDQEQQYVLRRANPKESWDEVFEKCAQDYITFGGMAINVIWNNEGTGIAEIYHADFTKIRSGHILPAEDSPEKYFYCHDWSQYRKIKPIEYHAFDPAKAVDHPSQILYFFDYEPGNLFYPLPSYAGSINDIQIDVEVSKFHLSNLANSLNPSLFIGLNNGIPEPEEREEIYDELTMAYRGTENAGKAFIAFSQDKDHAPDVIPIQSANDTYYTTLESRITTRILTGHRITSPLLLGLYHEGAGGGFSSNADELAVSYSHFIATCIRPIQKSMLKVFDNLFGYYGYTSSLYIQPHNVLEAGETLGKTVATDAGVSNDTTIK